MRVYCVTHWAFDLVRPSSKVAGCRLLLWGPVITMRIRSALGLVRTMPWMLLYAQPIASPRQACKMKAPSTPACGILVISWRLAIYLPQSQSMRESNEIIRFFFQTICSWSMPQSPWIYALIQKRISQLSFVLSKSAKQYIPDVACLCCLLAIKVWLATIDSTLLTIAYTNFLLSWFSCSQSQQNWQSQ